MNVCENIRRIRKMKNLSMKELGKKVGISEQGIGNYERGDRNPNLEILNKIADALEVSVNELIGTEIIETVTPSRELIKQFASPFEFHNANKLPKIHKTIGELYNSYEEFKKYAGTIDPSWNIVKNLYIDELEELMNFLMITSKIKYEELMTKRVNNTSQTTIETNNQK